MDTYKPEIYTADLLWAILLAPIVCAVVFVLPVGDYSREAPYIIPMSTYMLVLVFGLPYHIAMRKQWNDAIASYFSAGFLFGFFGIFFLTDGTAQVGAATLLQGGLYGGGVAAVARYIAGPVRCEKLEEDNERYGQLAV